MGRKVSTGTAKAELSDMAAPLFYDPTFEKFESYSIGVRRTRMKHDVFKIDGMEPADTIKIVTAIKTLPGILQSEVSAMRGDMYVEYDDMVTNYLRIVEAVTKTGFKAEVQRDDERVRVHHSARRTVMPMRCHMGCC
jgi:copper chaperone CopZ